MPQVSVILPVYNGEAYLREAVDSILAQTFADFELLIINDGSTDGSERIIASYKDNRVKHLKNEQNRGLIFSLNRGVEAAKGTYLARMDADDIALPERLEKQLAYLQRTGAGIVASRVKLIDPEGNPLPDWPEDRDNVRPEHIRRYLRKSNCIAHPTVFGKTELFKRYPYHFGQKYSEDYDLWLRMAADKIRIEKMEEPLLLHRILPSSFTRSKKTNLFYGLAKVKFRFFMQQAKKGHLTPYVGSIFLFALVDLVKAAGKETKALFTK
jgi:glycosyltransferase involved in cell wall biosynthesis